MGLPDTLAARFIETHAGFNLGGAFLMLGRQKWDGRRKSQSAELFDNVIETHLPGVNDADLENADNHFSETFFSTLGYGSVDSLDLSDFEGASIVQDLAGALDPSLAGRFDVIYDGGTCEHIFELPTAYRNIDRMLKPGGVLVGHSPTNNWVNHGFFQISPETVYGFWQNALKYEVLELFLQPLLPAFAQVKAVTTNPKDTGERPRIKGKLPRNSRIVMCYAVRKPKGTVAEKQVYQSDYVEKWRG